MRWVQESHSFRHQVIHVCLRRSSLNHYSYEGAARRSWCSDIVDATIQIFYVYTGLINHSASGGCLPSGWKRFAVNDVYSF